MLPLNHDLTPIDLDQFLDELRLIERSNGKVWICASSGFIGSAYQCGLSDLSNPAKVVLSISPNHFIFLDLTRCGISTATYSDANNASQIVQMYRLETDTSKLVLSTAAMF